MAYYKKNMNCCNSDNYGLVADAVEVLCKAYDKYLTEFRGLDYRIGFCDGKEVKFQINDADLAYLLGINPEHLCSNEMSEIIREVLGCKFTQGTNPFDILRIVINNITVITNHDKQNIGPNILDYASIWSKSSSFLEIMEGLQNGAFWCVSSTGGRIIKLGKYGEYEFFQETIKHLIFPKDEKLDGYNILKLKDNQLIRGYKVEKMYYSKRIRRILSGKTPTIPQKMVIDSSGDGAWNASGTRTTLLSADEKIELIRKMQQSIANVMSNSVTTDSDKSDQPDVVTECGRSH